MKRTASLSLDLDNQWSYMKASGIPGWNELPSYLDSVTPRILALFSRHKVRSTIFIVGQDATIDQNKPALAALAKDHEVGNHSFYHEPAIGSYTREGVKAELIRADDAIEAATGIRPKGFRGPSFALSSALLEALTELGYAYDASTFPTFIGPLARHYHFKNANLTPAEIEERALVFGTLSDGFRSLKPYVWKLKGGELLELPVTTIPLIRAPFHLTYLSFLAQVSRSAASLYFKVALRACQIADIEPSLLLHPLDFIGGDELPMLRAFPGMRLSTTEKIELLDEVIGSYAAAFDVVPMGVHATRAAAGRRRLPIRTPAFATDRVQ